LLLFPSCPLHSHYFAVYLATDSRNLTKHTCNFCFKLSILVKRNLSVNTKKIYFMFIQIFTLSIVILFLLHKLSFYLALFSCILKIFLLSMTYTVDPLEKASLSFHLLKNVFIYFLTFYSASAGYRFCVCVCVCVCLCVCVCVVCVCVCVCVLWWVWRPGLMNAKQAFYHWSKPPATGVEF
jgi:hypothetical protein